MLQSTRAHALCFGCVLALAMLPLTDACSDKTSYSVCKMLRARCDKQAVREACCKTCSYYYKPPVTACSQATDLRNLTSGHDYTGNYSGSTKGMATDFHGCGRANAAMFFIELQPGQGISIGQTRPTWYYDMAVMWGEAAACPTHMKWTKSDPSIEVIYEETDGYMYSTRNSLCGFNASSTCNATCIVNPGTTRQLRGDLLVGSPPRTTARNTQSRPRMLWFVVQGHYAHYYGSFTLDWQIDNPTSCSQATNLSSFMNTSSTGPSRARSFYFRVLLCAVRTFLKCRRSVPGHAIAAVRALKSSLWATTGGNGLEYRSQNASACRPIRRLHDRHGHRLSRLRAGERGHVLHRAAAGPGHIDWADVEQLRQQTRGHVGRVVDGEG